MGFQPSLKEDELIEGLNLCLDYLEFNDLKIVDYKIVPRGA